MLLLQKLSIKILIATILVPLNSRYYHKRKMEIEIKYISEAVKRTRVFYLTQLSENVEAILTRKCPLEHFYFYNF